ncbi:nucleotidyltransferase domain-containing protein [Halobacillus sp. MO56]
MKPYKKLNPVKAAHKFIEKYYPDCKGALLAGSVVRGEVTETSDLDIIIFDRTISSSYRESLIEFDWRIEVFVHNLTSYRQYFKSDCQRARPSLPRMVVEGFILKDEGIIVPIKQEAQTLLEKGPEEWSAKTIEMKRYFITDALEDLIGSSRRDEQLFIANTLAELVSEFVLRTNRRWIGTSKWTVRALKNYDERFAKKFIKVFDVFYQTGDKSSIIRLVDEILEPYGGRLFEGFSLGKND